MFSSLAQFIADESGASAIEYGLIIGMIAAVLVGVLTLLGSGANNLFGSVCDHLPGENAC